MIANFLRVGASTQGRTPLSNSNPTKSVFLRVRQTANSIADRVRHAILPAGVDFTPLRVLVVDDHPDAADTLAAVLEMLDCPARTCYDGPTALAIAADFQPQVCLLDLMMPKMDGLELASRLRQQAGGRPLMLVATTAFGDIEIRTQTATAGFHYHLLKPIDTMTLIETLAHLGTILKRPDEPPPEEA